MRLKALFFAAAGTLLITFPAISQNSGRPSEVHLRNQCRLAAQVLRTGHPADRRAWALDMIGNCDQEGPPVLAELWSGPPLDSAEVERVLDASSRIRDQRLADVASAIAGDEGSSERARLAAIILLVRYADPYSGLSVSNLAVPSGWKPGRHVRPIIGWHLSHAIPQVAGGVPLPAAFAPVAITRLRSLAETAENVRVRYAAAALAARLQS